MASLCTAKPVNSTTMQWIDYYLELAESVKSRSKDKRTKIGAVIVNDQNRLVSIGYNSFPAGINDDKEDRQVAPEKYYFMAHAEINAIVNAAYNGVSTRNGIMFSTAGVPCCACAKAIINAGIKKVWVKKDCTTIGEHWKLEQAKSITMFLEADIDLMYYEER